MDLILFVGLKRLCELVRLGFFFPHAPRVCALLYLSISASVEHCTLFLWGGTDERDRRRKDRLLVLLLHSLSLYIFLSCLAFRLDECGVQCPSWAGTDLVDILRSNQNTVITNGP